MKVLEKFPVVKGVEGKLTFSQGTNFKGVRHGNYTSSQDGSRILVSESQGVTVGVGGSTLRCTTGARGRDRLVRDCPRLCQRASSRQPTSLILPQGSPS